MQTPLIRLPGEGPAEIYLKLENLQPGGAYKIRGAASLIESLVGDQLGKGVFTASAGNMGLAMALIAAKLGMSSRVYVPNTTSTAKIQRMTQLGAVVEALPFEQWWRILETRGRDGEEGYFVHPCADRRVIEGNGTIALEILEDLPDADVIVTPFGGGGLTAGIAATAKALKPEIRTIAVECEAGAPLRAAIGAGRPVEIDVRSDAFIMGMGGRSVLPEIWPVVRTVVDETAMVTRAQMAEAVRTLAMDARIVSEGAGAVALAAALDGQCGTGKIVCVVSGGNIGAAMLADILGGVVPRQT